MTPRNFKKATIKNVAELAGVSKTTVSHVVSGIRAYNPETVEKVHRAIAELRYTPSYIAKGLRQQSTSTLGICGFDPLRIADPIRRVYAESIWRGVSVAADEADYSLLYYTDKIRRSPSLDPFLNGYVDGIIFTHLHGDNRPVALAEAGLPIVIQGLFRDLPDGVGCAYVNEAHVVSTALEHLWDLGHRKIAHLTGPVDKTGDQEPDEIALWRRDSFIDWTTERNIFNPDWVGHPGGWEPSSVLDIVQKWFNQPDRPTAIFCANDFIANQVIQTAQVLGWNVPRDLSVFGIDHDPTHDTPTQQISTIEIPVQELGRASVKALLQLIQGQPIEKCRIAINSKQVFIGNTTARPPHPRA